MSPSLSIWIYFTARTTKFGFLSIISSKSIPGNSNIDQLINAATIESGKYVTTIHEHTDEWGNRTIYCICGTKLYYWNGTAWTEAVDGLGYTLTLSENKRASMFSWKNTLFLSNGEEPAKELKPTTLYEQERIFAIDQNNNNIQLFAKICHILLFFGNNLNLIYQLFF